MNPYVELQAVANGDAGALRQLIADCYATATREEDWAALIEALLLARLTCARTGEPRDGQTLRGLLAFAIDTLDPEDDRETLRCFTAEVAALDPWLDEAGAN